MLEDPALWEIGMLYVIAQKQHSSFRGSRVPSLLPSPTAALHVQNPISRKGKILPQHICCSTIKDRWPCHIDKSVDSSALANVAVAPCLDVSGHHCPTATLVVFWVGSCFYMYSDSARICRETSSIAWEILRAKSNAGASLQFDRRPMALPY
jgi:hypothetical protein